MYGADANWGRIACAMGYSDTDYDVNKVTVDLASAKGRITVAVNGCGVPFSEEEAKEKLVGILLEHFGGYTIQEAHGGWIDGETVYREYTLVIYLSDTDLDHVHAAADEMIRVFDQSSVLIQANQTVTEFYDGAK